MNELKKYKFVFSWILKNKLAVGSSPLKQENIAYLQRKGIKNILGLCLESEVAWGDNISRNFSCERIFIPDSKSDSLPNFEDLTKILNKLHEYLGNGATFVHCFASVERSPLICIAWLIRHESLTIKQSLDYLMKVNRRTCPSANQLKLLEDFI